ncbi:hypothetical protein [Noviherbaspirillum denitrificans]|uniref:DUF4398 domain-containing protein n=1 Tax=Noviherbaspirillum denitrificans TaxID=1968433 RepID=A0A254TFF5_9BURK|nr:hypothetical protein [Noviherbaspirillum denitrificans]OWW20897.1 hypothetical protein AYR66_16885 [Noviherbaspirillum denitrificans]
MIGNRIMTRQMILRGAVAWLAAIACISGSFAQAPGGKVTDRFPSGSIRSIADADAALSAARAERAEIEARYLAEEQECHPKFFATSCIDQASDRRRAALGALRPVEIEANTFKRQSRVTERDRALSARLEKGEKERNERESRVDAEEPKPAHAEPATESAHNVQPIHGPDRQEKHEAKVKQQKVADAAKAARRTAKVAAYEKKKSDALERQRKVAERKVEKDRKRKAKQAIPNV